MQRVVIVAMIVMSMAAGAWAQAGPEGASPVAAPPATPSTPAARPHGTFQLGVGVSPDEQFIASARVANDDLFGTGQRLALDARVSALGQAFRLTHDAPGLLGAGLDLRTELFATQRRYHGFTRDGVGGALTVGQRIGRATRVYLRYGVEQVGVALDGGSDAARLATPPSRGDGRLATLGAGLDYDTRDALALPTRGTHLALFAERGAGWLGSDHDLVRLTASAEHARSLGPFTLRVAGRGAFVHGDGPGGVPLSERLQYGGLGEVAGYGLDAPFAARGAEYQASGRVELELPVWRGVSIAGFADAGVRGNRDPAWGPTGAEVYRSVGASIIWRSPLGPLRFDWAIPLDGPDREPRFQFGLGGTL